MARVRSLLFGAIAIFCSDVSGQQLYSGELGVTGAAAHATLLLPGGDLLTAGKLGGDLHLVRWTNTGDTLWTRLHPFPNDEAWALRLLSTGEVLVTGVGSSYLFDTDGDLIAPLDLYGLDAIELGPDSLLVVTVNSLLLKDRQGDLIWEQPLVMPDFCDGANSVLVSTATGFLVYSGCTDVFTHATVFLGRYGADGSFQDTVRLRSDGGSIAQARSFYQTSDGGAIGVGNLSTGTPVLVRTDLFGDTIWTRSFGFQAPVAGYPEFFDPQEVIERPDGTFVLSGIDGFPFRLRLLELDADGVPLCLEPIIPVDFPALSDLAVESGGNVHLMYTDQSETQALAVVMTGFDELCFSTGSMDQAFPPGGSCVRLTANQGQILLDRSNCRGRAHYTLIDAVGRVIATGTVGEALVRIDTNGAETALVMLLLTDEATGDRTAMKFVLP